MVRRPDRLITAMTALITPANVISYDNGKGGTMMTYLVHPDFTIQDERDRSLRAAERYELERALRMADEQQRAQRRARRQQRTRRYLRLVLGRSA